MGAGLLVATPGRLGDRVEGSPLCYPLIALSPFNLQVPAMPNATILPPGAGTHYDWSLDHVFIKTPDALTDGRVTLVEDTLKPGFNLSRHVHRQMVEIFYILEGRAEFAFDEETHLVTPGTTIIVPSLVWHAVRAPEGCKLLTIFTPGGFDRCLAEMAQMSEAQASDPAFITALEQRFDIWRR